MIILGIDPGTTSIGYAVLSSENRVPRLLDSGLLSVASPSPEERILKTHEELSRLCVEWHPRAVAVEKLFFEKNRKTALAVSEVRGIILLTAVLQKITLFEYTPLEVKKSVTGHGRADKRQVEKMIRLSVGGAASLRAADDVFDAIGIALTAFLLNKLG